ncbi:MAG: response regulator [Nitrospira sp.]|nr:response regulator [Nitrospira sp.]
MKILIVEDNEKNLKLFRSLLNSQGYETIEARDGEEGVRLAKYQKPDLILMDIQMPVMDGGTATRILKENPETKNIPVIALTSYAMKGDRERFLSEGFVKYIAKPIKLDEFLEVVRKYL